MRRLTRNPELAERPPSRLRRAVRIAVAAIVLAVIAAWCVFLRPAFLRGTTTYVTVVGTSMEPSFYGGDLAVVQREESYTSGDVIAYAAGGGLVIHRIVGGDGESGFQVRGDNKPTTDPWLPKSGDVVGKMWFSVPKLGLVVSILRDPPLLGSLVGLAAAATMFGVLQKRRSRSVRTRPSPRHPMHVPAGSHLRLALIVALATLTLEMAAGLVILSLKPTHTTSSTPIFRYSHDAAFT